MQNEEENSDIVLSLERYQELQNAEEWLMITSGGFGKRSSAYEYREASRGGQGVAGANIGRRGDRVIATFPVEEDNQIMLITSATDKLLDILSVTYQNSHVLHRVVRVFYYC